MSANEKNGMLLSYKSKKYRVIVNSLNLLKVQGFDLQTFETKKL